MRLLALFFMVLASGCAEESPSSLSRAGGAGDADDANEVAPATSVPATEPPSSSLPSSSRVDKHEVASTGTPPGELHEVKKGLWRGAHPDRAGLEHVKSLGVKTIVSLQQPDGSAIEGDKADEVAQEQEDAKALGLRYISVPMSSWSIGPTYDHDWDQVKPLLEKPDGVYVHCQHGHDRTGLIIALERVFVEGKSPEEAHDEWLALGHTPLLFMMDAYFGLKTKH